MTKTAVLAATIALFAAACGQGASASAEVASLETVEAATEDGGASPEEVDTEAAMLAMAECMREHGVDVADPEVDDEGNVLPPRPTDPESVDRDAMRTSRDACSEHLDGIEFGFQSVDQTELQDTLLEYASCMRDNGYDMPDPDLVALGSGPGGGGAGAGPFGELDRADPDFVSAQEVCEEVLAEFGFRGAGGPGGGRA